MIRKIYVTATTITFVILIWQLTKGLFDVGRGLSEMRAYGFEFNIRIPFWIKIVIIAADVSMISWIVLHVKEFVEANKKTIDAAKKAAGALNGKIMESSKSNETVEKDELTNPVEKKEDTKE